MPKATINDVAKLAGVSIKTVSRVVNREPNVRDATREKVEQAIASLHYQPNKAARSLASHSSHLIGLVYDDPSAYEVPSAGFIIRMQEGALNACRATGYELLIHPCRYQHRDVGNELARLIEEARPDGLIVAAPLSNTARIIRAIADAGTPFVRLSPGQQNVKQYSVSTNDREISAEMTRYLVSLGHTRIAFIQGDPDHKAVGNRYIGYKDGLEQSGLPFSDSLVGHGDNSIGSGEAAALKLLGLKNRPTAIFAANDDMAAGVIRIADRLGIKVPEELSVTGCDDITLAQQVYPALTTINQPLATMTERAALALIDATRQKKTLQGSEIVPAAIRVRDSTAPAPT